MKLLNQKGFAHLILIIIVIGVLVIVGGGIWHSRQSAEQPKQQGQKRDDLGCWPPSCSLIPDPQGKQMCEDWKAGKTVEWPACKYFSAQQACVKLCELEKKVATQGGTTAQKQAFNTLPAPVKAEFADSVSEEDRNLIIQGVSTMDFYLQKWFGKSISKSAGLRVGANAPTDMGEGSQVKTENGTMVILMETGSFVWKRQIQSNKEIGGEWRPRLAAHEYVHVYQHQNGCGRADAETLTAPKWFIEGEAEWLAYKATKEAGQLPPLSIPQLVIPQAKQVIGSLQSFENPNNLNFSAYFLYTMAIDYLMKDKPIKAIDDFCMNLADGNGMSAPKAFESAFGISLEKFYEKFESYRKSW